jgi:hypothetical protein
LSRADFRIPQVRKEVFSFRYELKRLATRLIGSHYNLKIPSKYQGKPVTATQAYRIMEQRIDDLIGKGMDVKNLSLEFTKVRRDDVSI